ncbi:MAG: thiol reductant ABC exporter subunit CydC [Marinobacter sp.]
MTDLLPWLRLLLQRKHRLLLGGLLMFTTILAGVGLLALSGWFITATALTGLLIASGVPARLDIYTPGGGIRFFAVARTVSRYVERLYNHDTVLRLLADVRLVVFGRLAAAKPATTRKRRPSDWLNRLTRDIDTLDTLYLQLIAPPGLAMAGLGLFALVLGVVAPLVLWALLPLALLPVALALLARRTLTPSRRQGYQMEALRGQLVDALEGSAELQAAHLWAPEADSLLSSSQKLDESRLETERKTALANGITLLAIQSAALLALVLGLELWQRGELSGPMALLITLAVLGVGEAFTGLPAAFSRLGATLGAARRLHHEGNDAQPALPQQAPLAAGPVGFRALTVHRNGERLFSPLTLTLPVGHRLALVGRSGTGKTSLLDFLAGLGEGAGGELTVDGQPLDPSASGAWRTSLGYLSQRTHFFSDTVRANLLMAKPEAADSELLSVLEAVALTDLLDTLPQGLDTWIGDQGRLLSGGERRRLALARTLLRPCWLLLLDEPFTGVDAATQGRICKSIEPWLSGRTCIFAGHGPEALPPADTILRLD